MLEFQLNNSSISVGNLENTAFQELITTTYENSRKVIIVDENTHDCCLEYVITAFASLEEAEVMLLPAGEENKVMEVCFQVWQALSEYGISRKDLIINLGGGMVTDMGGFMASVFKRGVDFIHIPTSLLGMVDASIGGKTGIDMGPYKNQLGTFADPKAIFIDPRFLHSLPSEEIINGFAEMMKHALIADAEHWTILQEIRPELLLEQDDLIELIANSVRIKSEIVEKDPIEKGPRKLLNFGHTIGHGIEGYFLENEAPIAHGHAVALGILTESYLSFKAGGLTSEELSRIISAVVTNFAAVNIDEIARKRILELMYNDKKNSGNRILGVLLQGIGSAVWDQEYQEMDVLEALMFLEDCYQAE